MKKIKFFFLQEKKISKILFTGLLIFAFILVFGNPIYAQFLRRTGSSGWGHGYGYGYGYGYGWDGGTQAGYRTTGGSLDEYKYNYGYGYKVGSYASSTGITLTSASDLATLYQQGIISIVGTNPAATSSVTFMEKLTLQYSVTTGTVEVQIPSGAVLTKTAGGNMDFTAFTSSNQLSSATITGQTIYGAIQFGIPSVGLTFSSAITIEVPVGTSLNGEGLNVFKSDTSATVGYSVIGSCVVSSGICSFTTTSLSYFATAKDDGSGDDGGDDGGGGGGTPVTEEDKEVTTTSKDVTIEVKDIIYTDPSDVTKLVKALGAVRSTKQEAKYAPLVVKDLKEFKVIATDQQRFSITNFIVYGISSATQKLGEGEGRALIRDYLEIVGRANIDWADIERMATGQKPVNRNLTKEQAQLGQVLARFEKLFGHRPNFKDSKEDLAWNTMMYRIRFTRNLDKEKVGITKFKAVFKTIPTSPLDWSTVRAWGYIF